MSSSGSTLQLDGFAPLHFPMDDSAALPAGNATDPTSAIEATTVLGGGNKMAAASSSIVYDLAILALLLALLRYLLTVWWRHYHTSVTTSDGDAELSRLPLPPGSFGLPIIGETFSWLRLGAKFNANRRAKYGNVFSTNVLLMPMVKVTGHQYVREILCGEHSKVTTIWPRSVRDILGAHGLVNSTFDVHKYKRRIASRAFTRDALDGYFVAMRDISARNVAAMAAYERPRIYDAMLRQTFDIAVNALLGLELSNEEGRLDEMFSTFNDLVSNIFCLPYSIPGCGYVKGMRARAKIMKMLTVYIERKREWLRGRTIRSDPASGKMWSEEEEEKPMGAIDIILREEIAQKQKMRRRSSSSSLPDKEASERKSEDEDAAMDLDDVTMKEMMIELMFAGYFTSASAITSTVLELALNPQVFAKLETEVREHGMLTGDPSAITSAAVSRMTYLDRVVKETLRLRPPVLGAYRKAIKTFQIGEYRIPKGWTVIYNIRDTHDFESKGNDRFDPDNFDKNISKSKHSYIPFGGGPRMCIGQEYARLIIKISVVNMIRHFRKWELVSSKSLKMKAIPTLHPRDGLPLKLYPRHLDD